MPTYGCKNEALKFYCQIKSIKNKHRSFDWVNTLSRPRSTYILLLSVKFMQELKPWLLLQFWMYHIIPPSMTFWKVSTVVVWRQELPGLLRVLEILECTWFLQWQFPGLESTWKWKKVLENSWKNTNGLTKALYLQKIILSLVIRSVRQAFPSFFLRNLEIQQLLYTYRTVKVIVSTPCVYYTDITFVLGKIKFVLKNFWISPGKIFNLLCMNPELLFPQISHVWWIVNDSNVSAKIGRNELGGISVMLLAHLEAAFGTVQFLWAIFWHSTLPQNQARQFVLCLRAPVLLRQVLVSVTVCLNHYHEQRMLLIFI